MTATLENKFDALCRLLYMEPMVFFQVLQDPKRRVKLIEWFFLKETSRLNEIITVRESGIVTILCVI